MDEVVKPGELRVLDSYLTQMTEVIDEADKRAIAELIWANAFEQFYTTGIDASARAMYGPVFDSTKHLVSAAARMAWAEL